MLGVPTPVGADPTGSESFCFQKRVVKDGELFDLASADEGGEPNERGFADVWKRGCFAWEDKGKKKHLGGHIVSNINSHLTSAAADITKAERLAANRAFGFVADVKAGQFDLHESASLPMLHEPDPNRRPNSDEFIPWVNSLDILRRRRGFWIVDFGAEGSHEFTARYTAPYAKVLSDIFPLRSKVKRKTYRDYWWLPAEPCAEMRVRINPLPRFLVTTTVSKHCVFARLSAPTLPDPQLVAFTTDDDYFFGVLDSRLHEVWALATGTQLREKESGFRYTPTTCFETFPLSFADDTAEEDPLQTVARFRAADCHFDQDNILREEPTLTSSGEHRAAIAAAAKELNELRECWLNPPEWTQTRAREFSGSVDGPWARRRGRPSTQTAGSLPRKTGGGNVVR